MNTPVATARTVLNRLRYLTGFFTLFYAAATVGAVWGLATTHDAILALFTFAASMGLLGVATAFTAVRRGHAALAGGGANPATRVRQAHQRGGLAGTILLIGAVGSPFVGIILTLRGADGTLILLGVMCGLVLFMSSLVTSTGRQALAKAVLATDTSTPGND